MQERCPSPTARRLMTKRACPGGQAVLVGSEHDRGVAQRRRLDRVLVGEVGAHEQPALAVTAATPPPRRWATRSKCSSRVGWSSRWRPPKPARTSSTACGHVLVGQGQDPVDHAARPGFAVAQHLLAGNEQPGEDPAGIGAQPQRQPLHQGPVRPRRSGLVTDQADALLERRDEGDGRLRALVVVAPAALQAVVAAAGAGVGHRDLRRRCRRGTRPPPGSRRRRSARPR